LVYCAGFRITENQLHTSLNSSCNYLYVPNGIAGIIIIVPTTFQIFFEDQLQMDAGWQWQNFSLIPVRVSMM